MIRGVGETVIFRSWSARALSIGALIVGVLAIGTMIVRGDLISVLTIGPVVLAAVIGVWVLFWWPRLVVSDGGLWVINPLRTVHLPWPVFESATVRWGMQIRADGQNIGVWAVPADSASARFLRRRRRAGLVVDDHQGLAAAALQMINDRHRALERAGHLGAVTIGSVGAVRRWNRGPLAAMIIAAALLLLGPLAAGLIGR